MRGIFFTSRGPVSFSGRTLLHAVNQYIRTVQTLVATWSRRPTSVQFCCQPYILLSTSQQYNRATMVSGSKVLFFAIACRKCVKLRKTSQWLISSPNFRLQPQIEFSVEGQPRYWEHERALRMRRAQYHLSGGQSPVLHHGGPGSIPGESTWDLC
jgi:hypothetical protein